MSNPYYHLKHFKPIEFDSPDEFYSGLKMSLDFLTMLDEAREIAGIPFKINSGYRTTKHNKAIGGSPTSSHMKGLAVDLSYKNNLEALKIVAALTDVGCYRIGISSNFIHCDNDVEKTWPAYWTYDE